MSGGAAQKDKILRETEAMLRAVLISSPRGVHFEKLQRDYKELTLQTIPFKELGYPRLENFLQSIPAVARVEKGSDGEWIVRGVASDADKHVAKLISKQKKPTLRKSARALMARKRPTPMSINTPVRKPAPRPQGSKTYNLPPRMARLKEQNRNKSQHPGQGSKTGKGKENAVARSCASIGRGEMFKRATEEIKTSRNNEKQRHPSLSSKETPNLSVNISSANQNRSVTAVTSPERPTASGVLDDPASIKYILSEIRKVQAGLWATRLQVLYKEKFKKVLPESFMQELKFRPDIARVDEPIPGRFLLYVSQNQQPAPPSGNQRGVKPPVKMTSDFVLPCYLPEVGISLIVYISHMDNPSCFYVSREDTISELLSDKIQKHYQTSTHNSKAIPSVSPGQIYCAKFTQDGSFYRACVLEVIDSKRIKVQYVDFGNKEIITVDHLRVLIKDFQTQPIQAYGCCLDGVQPADQASEWNAAAIDKFDELTSGKELRMTVQDVDGEFLSVSLVDVSSQLDIAEELKKAGLAVSTKNLVSTPSSSSSSLSSSSVTSEKSLPKPENVGSISRRLKSKSPGIVELPDEQFIDVFVCNITGTYNVFLRLIGEEYSTKFEAIQESMTSYYSDSKDEVTTEPAVGDLFALVSDEVWCRVRVIGVNGGKIQVFFVDHGDEVETTKAELRPLADQFRKLPFQVFRCALHGLPGTKNPDVVEKLKKLILGEEAVGEIIKRTDHLVFIELLDTRTDANIVVNHVIRKLVIPDEELKPVLPKVGKTTDVDIAYISSTGSVFLHVSVAGSKRLEELNRDLTEHYTLNRSKASEFISNPTAGKVCCAKCDDGNWYRAKILSYYTDKNAVEVIYVDYGNTEVVPVTNLREPTQANAHVLSLPFQALECQLYDVPKDDWNNDMADRIFEIVEQGTLSAEVLSDGNPPSVSLLVTVESEGKQVTQRLAWYLGCSDMLEYEDDVYQVAPEHDQENVDGEDGEGLVNGGKLVKNMESETASEVNVETDNAGQATRREEKAAATGVTNVGVKDETPVRKAPEEKISKDVSEDTMNGIKATDSEVESELPTNHLQWKALQLQTDWFDVFITDVENPEDFTFQLFDNDPEITKLAEEMNSYYQNQVGESEVTLIQGSVYAVLYEEDECWYRGLVESIINSEKAYVRFLDYGGHVTVNKEDVRVLDEKFQQLPFQGVPARLAGVKSTKARWSKTAIKNFKFLAADRYLVAKTIHGDSECNCYLSAPVTVRLCDTEDPRKDVYIAEKFIEENSDVVPE